MFILIIFTKKIHLMFILIIFTKKIHLIFILIIFTKKNTFNVYINNIY